MSLPDKLLPMKHAIVHREKPSWEEIVAHVHGKGLSFFADTVVRVIDSKDHAKRIIILRSDWGYYKSVYEEIHVWDEDEWNYFCNDLARYPAYWEAVASSINTNSFYGTEEDAIKAIAESYEYKIYFT